MVQNEGLKELFAEISPIASFNKALELHFGDFYFGEPKYPEEECRERDITFAAPLWVKVKLLNRETGEVSEQEVFMGDFPLMTDAATFIINGSERVVVSQLIRSPGVYFTVETDRGTGRDLAGAKMIPSRGAWLEFETSKRDIISVKVDRKRKLPVTLLLRAWALAPTTKSAPSSPTSTPTWITPTSSPRWSATTPATPRAMWPRASTTRCWSSTRSCARATRPRWTTPSSFVQNLFFSSRRYDLGKVGRYKLNRRLGLDTPIGRAHPHQRRPGGGDQAHHPINNGEGRPTTSITWATAASRPWAS
jgi:DNA-directed RNA polymerase subunit beta